MEKRKEPGAGGDRKERPVTNHDGRRTRGVWGSDRREDTSVWGGVERGTHGLVSSSNFTLIELRG